MKFFYNTRKINFLFIIFILFFSFFTSNVLASETSGTITPSSGYAWGPILGWINFACTNCNVNITDTALTGYAWSDQYGWINLSPANGGVTNNCLGQLGGTAWSSHLGWINFSGASIDSNGKFEDLAGSPTDKSGNINFACTNCNVETDWKQCSLRAAPTPQVLINSVAATTTPNVSANVTITNEGAIPYEYSYEWCVSRRI